MKSLAVIVSKGRTNDFIQVVTLLMAAVHSELRVRVLFRDESVLRLTPDAINHIELSDAYRAQEPAYRERLKKHELEDLRTLVAQIKASGDVKLYACSSSMALAGLKQQDLITEVDEVRGLPAFLLEDVAQADRVLTF